MHLRKPIRREPRRAPMRRAVAAVEFAVSLPVLVLVVLGTIEITNAIFLRQSLHVAAYEGARELAAPNGTPETAQAVLENILKSRSIKTSSITMTPSDPTALVRGATVSVEVAAKLSGNSPIVRFVRNRTITVRVVMCHK